MIHCHRVTAYWLQIYIVTSSQNLEWYQIRDVTFNFTCHLIKQRCYRVTYTHGGISHHRCLFYVCRLCFYLGNLFHILSTQCPKFIGWLEQASFNQWNGPWESKSGIESEFRHFWNEFEYRFEFSLCAPCEHSNPQLLWQTTPVFSKAVILSH